jgi:hypothetical protein
MRQSKLEFSVKLLFQKLRKRKLLGKNYSTLNLSFLPNKKKNSSMLFPKEVKRI